MNGEGGTALNQEYIWATSSFGEVVKRGREAKGMTQRELANVCEVSSMYISQIEANERIPSGKVIIAIAENLTLSAKHLFFLGLRNKYGKIWDALLGEDLPEADGVQVSPELKYIVWMIENLPEEKRKQTMRALEETLKLALI